MSGDPTGAAFDGHHWHDDEIHAFALRVGDPERDDWTSDLALDLDHIVEWVSGSEGMRFRVAPASLHGVTDLRIDIDGSRVGPGVSIMLPSISHLTRERVREQRVFMDRPYYHWRIVLNGTPEGEIAFGAVGYEQTLRAEPILVEQPRLHGSQRGVAGTAW